jgi:putative tryptophan/tyrosine transport system substrate-binding protein
VKRKITKLALAALLFVLSCPAEAQQSTKIPRIGVMFSGQTNWSDAFRQGLQNLGYIEGKNILVEYRDPQGKEQRYLDIVTELVALKVDVIVVGGLSGARAAHRATKTIPIVMAAGGDPVSAGLVASLARPGGNVTGITILGTELTGKRLELLKEALPKVSRVGVLWNPAGQSPVAAFKQTQAAAESLGLTIVSLELKRHEDLEPVLEDASRKRTDALLVVQDSVTGANLRRIAEVAAKHRLPAMYWEEAYVEAGGLMSYGPDYPELYRRAAIYVDKILKGTKPAELPVEQPTRFELVINLKAAKQIGLKIPPNVLARADKVIR